MDRSTELRIPTVAVAVRIVIHGRAPVDAELFVADTPRGGRGELIDDVADMLDEPAAFVPVRDAATVRLVSKRAIAWLAIRRRVRAAPRTDFPEEPSEVLMLYDRQHRVEIEVEGTRLTGLLLDSSPADRPRVVDYLNRVPRFVRLWTPEEQVLINKAAIVDVIELPDDDAGSA